MKRTPLLILFNIYVISTVFCQPLKIAESREGQGSYFAKGIVLPNANDELIMMTQGLLYTFGDKVDATQFSSDLNVKGEKIPFLLWGDKGGVALAKNFFVTDFDKDRTIFSAREYTGKVDFGYSKFGDNILAPPTWNVLFTYKINPNSQDAHQFENRYLLGGHISDDLKKIGVVYFPDGNKGKTDNASTLNIACYDANGIELWSKSGELPNESRFRIRIIDTKTDNKGNVFAIVNYIRFSTPYYISKGQYVIAAGPDFETVQAKAINFNKSIITIDKRTWVDQKGGYYVIGTCREDLGQEKYKPLSYFGKIANTDGDNIEINYLNEINKSFPEFETLTPTEKNDFPNRVKTNIETDGIYMVDDNHFLMLVPSKFNTYTAFLMNKEGDILDQICIDFKGAAYLEEGKTPYFKKIGEKIYLFYQGVSGEKNLYGSVTEIPEPPTKSASEQYKDLYSSSLFLQDINTTGIIGKYIVFENNKFEKKEYIIEGSDGFGMASHMIKMKGNNYFFFNRKNGKKDVGYKLVRFE